MVVSQPVLRYRNSSVKPCLGRKIAVEVQIVGITLLSEQPRLIPYSNSLAVQTRTGRRVWSNCHNYGFRVAFAQEPITRVMGS